MKQHLGFIKGDSDKTVLFKKFDSYSKFKEKFDRMPKNFYPNIIGSMMYLMIYTRSDVAHNISVLSIFMDNPWEKALECFKMVVELSEAYFWSRLSV